jgi:hypothetical protein
MGAGLCHFYFIMLIFRALKNKDLWLWRIDRLFIGSICCHTTDSAIFIFAEVLAFCQSFAG